MMLAPVFAGGLGHYDQSMVTTEVLRAEEDDGQTVTGTLDINRNGSIQGDADRDWETS